MFITTIYLTLCRLELAFTAPISGTTSWKSDPGGRGTVSLLISCLATLSFCVHSSLHLNVPQYKETKLSRKLRAVKWLLIGVFAPEVVLYTAWRQYTSARALTEHIVGNTEHIVRMMRREQGISPSQGTDFTWTLTHGFYASMGGFVIDMTSMQRDPANAFTPAEFAHPRLTLTAPGVKLLYDCGHLPNVQLDDIMDKSKSDGLGKIIVCLQMTWFTIQVLARLIGRLPVTLLEVTTIAHIVCSLLIYGLWWHKPQLINEPTRLDGEPLKPLLAFMYLSGKTADVRVGSIVADDPRLQPSRTKLNKLKRILQRLIPKEAAQSETRWFRCRVPADRLKNDDLQALHDFADSYWKDGNDTAVADEKRRPTSQIDIPGTNGFYINEVVEYEQYISKPRKRYMLREIFEDEKAWRTIFASPETTASRRISSKEAMKSRLLRWRLAAEAFCNYRAVSERFRPMRNRSDQQSAGGYQDWRIVDREVLIQLRAPNYVRVPIDPLGQLLMKRYPVKHFVLSLIAMVVGAIHIAAWAGHFPTTAEQWIWRVCSIYITTCAGLWIFTYEMSRSYRVFVPYLEGILSTYGILFWKCLMLPFYTMSVLLDSFYYLIFFGSIAISVFICVCLLPVVVYVFARIFLVLEAFISLRDLPVAAYETPEWSQLIPHL